MTLLETDRTTWFLGLFLEIVYKWLKYYCILRQKRIIFGEAILVRAVGL